MCITQLAGYMPIILAGEYGQAVAARIQLLLGNSPTTGNTFIQESAQAQYVLHVIATAFLLTDPERSTGSSAGKGHAA